MARLRFRDRFFTPPVARAMMSPSGILLAGAGLSVGIVAGIPLLAAAGLGAVAWGVRVAAAVPRTPSTERIDPFTLNEPWRRYVQNALQAQARFNETVSGIHQGPLQDRLRQVGERIDVGVRESWRVARHGQAVADARRNIDVAKVTTELQGISTNAQEPWAAGSSLARTAESLDAQLQSARRMDEVVGDTEARLRMTNAKLDEAVARAVELSVPGVGPESVGSLGTEVDSVVEEMEALRAALDESDASPLPGTA
jgi:hypothetical protein